MHDLTTCMSWDAQVLQPRHSHLQYKISYNMGAQNIDVIGEMETDMGNDIIGKMNNKVIDSNFAQVLRRSQGIPLKRSHR